MRPTSQKAALILDAFPGYLKRKHAGRKMTTIDDVRQRQVEYLLRVLHSAYRAGYNDACNHYQGKK